jgi:hypothetical protein
MHVSLTSTIGCLMKFLVFISSLLLLIPIVLNSKRVSGFDLGPSAQSVVPQFPTMPTPSMLSSTNFFCFIFTVLFILVGSYCSYRSCYLGVGAIAIHVYV